MARNLIVCCDGTWNTEEQEKEVPSPTNVVKLRNCLEHETDVGEAQSWYYHSGVGTEGGPLNRLAGGLYGKGIGRG